MDPAASEADDWGTHLLVAGTSVVLLPLVLALGFHSLDRPQPQAAGAALGYGAAAVLGAGAALWPLFAGRRLRTGAIVGMAAGLPLAFHLVVLATRYTTDRTCHTHQGWFWSDTSCTATPGGGPDLVLTASLVLALGVGAIALAAAIGRRPGAREGAATVAALVGVAYGVAGLVLLVLLPGEAADAATANAVERTQSTPGPAPAAVLGLLATAAVAWRRRRG